ncbi:hypothetical protein IWX85_000603 [Polaromonas sp. CG_9.11]|nr:hypothetical protein [Polaromonas sp. CG_9.11]
MALNFAGRRGPNVGTIAFNAFGLTFNSLTLRFWLRRPVDPEIEYPQI